MCFKSISAWLLSKCNRHAKSKLTWEMAGSKCRVSVVHFVKGDGRCSSFCSQAWILRRNGTMTSLGARICICVGWSNTFFSSRVGYFCTFSLWNMWTFWSVLAVMKHGTSSLQWHTLRDYNTKICWETMLRNNLLSSNKRT